MCVYRKLTAEELRKLREQAHDDAKKIDDAARQAVEGTP